MSASLRDAMSYDLFVFNLQDRLKDREAFLDWYDEQTRWTGGIDYSNPSNASASLRFFYQDLIRTFPPINGPDRLRGEEMDESRTADYCVGRDFIYVAFSGGNGRYESTFELAKKHGLGFFDASGDGTAWYPSATGELEMLYGPSDSDRPGGMQQALEQAAAGNGVIDADNVVDAITKLMELHKDPSPPTPVIRTPSLGKLDDQA